MSARADFDAAFDAVLADALPPDVADGLNDGVDLLAAGVPSGALVALVLRLEEELALMLDADRLAARTDIARVGCLREECRAAAEEEVA